MNRILAILVFGALLSAQPSHALDPGRLVTQYNVDTWYAKDGLPQNSVHAIYESPDGYLWFGTEEGLTRFDGIQFTTFNSAGGYLRHNFIVSLSPARGGGFWIGSLNGGLARYKDGTFTQRGQDLGISSDPVRPAYEDTKGGLWVGTVGGGLIHHQNGRTTTYTHRDGLSSDLVRGIVENPDGSLWVGTSAGLNLLRDGKISELTTRDGLPDNSIQALYRDRNGSLWIGTLGGLSRYADGRFTNFHRADGLPNDAVFAVCGDREGNLWIGTESGLCRYRGGQFASLTVKEGLSGDRVRSIYEDREGSLWVGTTGGGLTRLQNGKFVVYTTREGLAHDAVGPVFQDSRGTVWVGTRGGGVSCYRNGVINTYTTRDGLPSNLVESIWEDHAGVVWLGTFDKGLVRFKNGSFASIPSRVAGRNTVSAIYEDTHGNLWVSYIGRGIERRTEDKVTTFTTADGLAHDMVRMIFESRDGAIWFGTLGGGLSRYENGRFTNFSTRNGLSHDVIGTMYQDVQGTLWIGTLGGGLIRYKDGVFRTITTHDGLFDDTIYSILEDTQGYFWMSSNKGIERVSHHDLDRFADGKLSAVEARVFGESDGMRSRECNGNSPGGIKAKDGSLWFSTLGGAVVIDPLRAPFNRRPPPVLVERVIADHKELPPRDGPRVPPGKGELEFHYTALSYLAPEQVRFRYRLEGFDKQWVDAGSRRVAYYTNILPGRYTFRVAACNNDGVWNEAGASYAIGLAPHFYQTPLFYAGCALIVALLGVRWHRWRVRRLEQRAAELRDLAEERRIAQEALAESNRRLEKALEELRLAQSSLVQQERLRALGQMASGVTHDFNNALTPIVGYTDFILAQPQILDDHERTMAYLTTVNAAAKDAANVVSRLRGFYRPRDEAEVFPLVGVDAIVRQAVSMTQPKWKDQALAKGIPIEVKVDLATMPLICGNESDLREMLTNVTFNAVDAMPEGGTITIRSRVEGESVVLEVQDTGTGMTEEVRRHCLEPFFTTKGDEGTGLGLPMVYGIVRRHGGTVQIESAPGEGTRFAVRLPIRTPAALKEPVGAAKVLPDGPRGLRVLIVDDEPRILNLVSAYLRADEHVVETAADGLEGLNKIRTGSFDLVVTDRSMPKMNGVQLAAAAKRLHPSLPIVLLTGFGELMADQDEHPEGVDLILNKPVTHHALRDAMASVLAVN